MSKYDDEKTTKGKITSLKLNAKLESKAGKEYKAHVLKVEDGDGEVVRFQISPKSKASKFVEKLEVGQDVAVKEAKGDYGMQVVAVFVNGKGGKPGFAKTNTRKEYDPTGAIQGMVLKAAIDIAIRVPNAKTEDLQEKITEAAKVVLIAKLKVDKLVSTALKSKEEDDSDDGDSDDDSESSDQDEDSESSEDQDEEDSEEEDRPRKKKKSPY